MGIRLYQEPKLDRPVLIAGWPGIGNIGIIAVHTLRGLTLAQEFGEIEPWDFFYPRKLFIRNGLLEDMEFPASRFYFAKTQNRDLLFFIGEEQPSEGRGPYAEGRKAYDLSNLVLDVALKFGCQRVYTSGAAVAPVHHSARPRVWAVPNSRSLLTEVKGYDNTILMSDVEGKGGQGNITGLNGLLLGAARKRGLDAISLMGEIPVYLQGLPLPYPKASKSVLEVLVSSLGIKIELDELDSVVAHSERDIEKLYESFPAEVREQLDKLKFFPYAKPTEPGPITEEDKNKILQDLDKFFKKGPRED